MFSFLWLKCENYCVHISKEIVSCLHISTRLHQMNNKALNSWHKYNYIYLCEIVIKKNHVKILLFVGAVWCIGQGNPYRISAVWNTLIGQLCSCFINTHIPLVEWYIIFWDMRTIFQSQMMPDIFFWNAQLTLTLTFLLALILAFNIFF